MLLMRFADVQTFADVQKRFADVQNSKTCAFEFA